MVRKQQCRDLKCAPVSKRCRVQEYPVAIAATPGEDYLRAIRAGLQDPVGHMQHKTASIKSLVGASHLPRIGKSLP